MAYNSVQPYDHMVPLNTKSPSHTAGRLDIDPLGSAAGLSIVEEPGSATRSSSQPSQLGTGKPTEHELKEDI